MKKLFLSMALAACVAMPAMANDADDLRSDSYNVIAGLTAFEEFCEEQSPKIAEQFSSARDKAWDMIANFQKEGMLTEPLDSSLIDDRADFILDKMRIDVEYDQRQVACGMIYYALKENNPEFFE